MIYKITALKVQNKNSNRVNVYLDGAFAFGVAKVLAAWLKVGQEIDDGKISELKERDHHEVALQKALHYLDYRPRSEKEVNQKLIEKGFEDHVIQGTIDRLKNVGLIGDEAFARTWVENRVAFRPRSHRALAMELRQKGVESHIIDVVLSETEDDDHLCYEVANKQKRRYEGLEWSDFRNRLSGYLSRKGFQYSSIQPVVRRLWNEVNEVDVEVNMEQKIIENHQDKEEEDV